VEKKTSFGAQIISTIQFPTVAPPGEYKNNKLCDVDQLLKGELSEGMALAVKFYQPMQEYIIHA